MKLKKLLIILCFIIFLSGCTIRSNVNVAYDGKTIETVKVLAENEKFKSDKYSKKQVIESIIEKYVTVLDFRKYSYDVIEGEELSGGISTKTYDDICSYFQDTVFNQYVYHHISCTENEYYYEIKNDTNYIPYCSDCSDWPILNNIEFKITLPVSAEEQNADEIKGNTYIWRYSEDTSYDKNFYLKISKSALKQNEQEYLEALEREKNTKIGLIIGTIISVLIVIVAIGLILYKKYQKNKLDY